MSRARRFASRFNKHRLQQQMFTGVEVEASLLLQVHVTQNSEWVGCPEGIQVGRQATGHEQTYHGRDIVDQPTDECLRHSARVSGVSSGLVNQTDSIDLTKMQNRTRVRRAKTKLNWDQSVNADQGSIYSSADSNKKAKKAKLTT